jgi:hypothetical protein
MPSVHWKGLPSNRRHYRDYTAAPVYFNGDECGAHEWLIEFEKKPTEFERFVDMLDETLRRINSDYDAKRFKDMALRRPIFARYRKVPSCNG